MSELEGIFLEKFFLEPGSEGTIGSVSVDDDVLIEIFGAADLDDLQQRFVGTLLKISRLKALLAGEFPPLPGRTPDYLRILMFVCWMQTSKVREEDDTDFREMLGRHTGVNFLGALMRGLNPMWEHLQTYLAKEHGIDLDLPAPQPFRQIGRTLRIAFPTLRDRLAFRRLRQTLGPGRLLDPLEVSRGVRNSRDLVTETMPSFAYNFELFDGAWKRGGREFTETTFWKAWYSIVATHASLEELEIVRGDFGDHEIFRVSPSGDRRPIGDPEGAAKFVPDPIAKAIRNGIVLMEDLGFGRSRATSSMESNLILMHRSRLGECDEGVVVSHDNVNAYWVLANFRNSAESDAPTKSARREIGWRNGIKVGGAAYLGISPFTPILALPDNVTATVSMAGEALAMNALPNGVAFPPGIYAGTATAQANGQYQSILLVPRAAELPVNRRLSFDRFRDIGEDEFHYDTLPSTDTVLDVWPGPRVPACEAMTAIAEALYARTGRGLAFVEALGIIRQGLSETTSGPKEWDILRAFADAGWFDLTLVRNFPAQKLLQRPITVRAGNEVILIDGPTPLAVIEHVESAAKAAGATVELHNGVSEWSLPRMVVRVGDRNVQRDFVERFGYPEDARTRKAQAKQGEQHDAHGYHVVARFDAQRGFFVSRFDDQMPEGLYRLERNEGKRPYLYRSVVGGKPAENFASPSIAILSHHARMSRRLFRYDGSLLVGSASRVVLPSSWAQWASDRTVCNAGLVMRGGTWIYAYPLGSGEVSILSGLIAIERSGTGGTPWIDRFTASASNRGKAIHDGRSGKIRRAGSALEKRN
ncbi:hypothetical protein [Rhizobium mongolense]|uniref:Uncharacterized protein n=1 Tax=Rhizobium mongolense TaxID=57676 RepID=A0A7W6RLH9_9HYPH|nr:hypothetical protein [Rhizobium mongolense]MBB4274126.1 hypothetical protein [Rhizobium mongolense]